MNTLAAMKYASVVLRESVRIALLITTLNNLDLLCTNVHNDYLNVPPREKTWFKAEPEFGQYKGRVVVIV